MMAEGSGKEKGMEYVFLEMEGGKPCKKLGVECVGKQVKGLRVG